MVVVQVQGAPWIDIPSLDKYKQRTQRLLGLAASALNLCNSMCIFRPSLGSLKVSGYTLAHNKCCTRLERKRGIGTWYPPVYTPKAPTTRRAHTLAPDHVSQRFQLLNRTRVRPH